MNSNVFISNRKKTSDLIHNRNESLSENELEENRALDKDSENDLSIGIKIPKQNGENSSKKPKNNIYTCKKITSKENTIPQNINLYNTSTNLNTPFFTTKVAIEKITNLPKNNQIDNRNQRYTESGIKNYWNTSTFDVGKKRSATTTKTFEQNEDEFNLENLSINNRLTSVPKMIRNKQTFKILNDLNNDYNTFTINNIRRVPQDEPQNFQGNFNNDIINLNANYNTMQLNSNQNLIGNNNVANGGFNNYIKAQNINDKNLINDYRERYLNYQNEQSQLNGNNLISVKRIPYKNTSDNIKKENLNTNLNLNSNNIISQSPEKINTLLQPLITYQKFDNGNSNAFSPYDTPNLENNNNNNLSNTQKIKIVENSNILNEFNENKNIGYHTRNKSAVKSNFDQIPGFSLEMNMNGNNVTNLNNFEYLIPERKGNNITGFHKANVLMNYPNPTPQNMIIQQPQIDPNRNININLNNQNLTQNLTQNITQINYGNTYNQDISRGTVINQEIPRANFINKDINQDIALETIYNQKLQNGPIINQNAAPGIIYNQNINRPSVITQNIGKVNNQDLSRNTIVKKIGPNSLRQQNNTQINMRINRQILNPRAKQIITPYENEVMNLSNGLTLNQNNYNPINPITNKNEQYINNGNLQNINNTYVNDIRTQTIRNTQNLYLNNLNNQPNPKKTNLPIVNKLNNQIYENSQQQRNIPNINPITNTNIQRLTIANKPNTPYTYTQNQNIDLNPNENYNTFINRNTISAPETTYTQTYTPEPKKDVDITYNDFDGSGYIKNYGGVSRPGIDENGNQKTNQDSLATFTNINGIKDFNIFGVLDGHGTEGHLISQLISKFIPLQIINDPEIKLLKNTEQIYQKLTQNNYLIIKNAYQLADNHLATTNEIDCSSSGTTCVLIIQIGPHIICSNAGDSRAILAYDQNSDPSLNFLRYEALSTDYKPEIPEEMQRIINNGGVVEQLKGSDGLGCGPYRVFISGKEYPGLAMSRSIGDVQAKTVGCIPIPGIMECVISNKTKFVVICSDGVWEFLSNELVAGIGKEFYLENDASGLCHELVKESLKQWMEQDVMVDDITAVVCFF